MDNLQYSPRPSATQTARHRPKATPLQPLTPLSQPLSPRALGRRDDVGPEEPLLSPRDRLERLIGEIEALFLAYSHIPARNPLHMEALRDFHARASRLHPARKSGDRELSRSPSPSVGATSPPQTTALIHPPHGACSGEPRTGGQYTNGAGPGPTSAEVERLEREWWSSAIVAAWYGPPSFSRPRSTRADVSHHLISQIESGRSRGSPSAVNSHEEPDPRRRGASYVGLYDE